MSKKVSRGNRVFKHKKRKESMDTTKSQFELFLAKKKYIYIGRTDFFSICT